MKRKHPGSKNFPKTCTIASIERMIVLGNLTSGEYGGAVFSKKSLAVLVPSRSKA